MTRGHVVFAALLLSIGACRCGADETCLKEPLSRSETIGPGTACEAGGTLVHTGGDANCDGTLDNDEVTHTTLICGDPQGQGQSGQASLLEVAPIPPGDVCAEGGAAIRAGIDDDKDGVLDPAEVDSETFTCNGLNGEIDEANCDNHTNVYTGTLVVPDETSLGELDGITCVDGNVIVNSGTLTTLERASSLQKVTGDFLVLGNAVLQSLQGLRALEFVGSTLMISNNELIEDLQGLENLEKFGALKIIGNKQLESLHGLENLETTGGEIEINAISNLTNLDGLQNLIQVRTLRVTNNDRLDDISALDTLTRATGQIVFFGNDSLLSINLRVQRVDVTLDILENERLQTVDLPFLILLGDLHARDNPSVSMISLPSLATAAGIELQGNAALVTFSAPNMVYVSGELRANSNAALTRLDLPSLTTIGGAFNLRGNASLPNFAGLEALETVGGVFAVRENAVMTNFSGLGALLTVTGNAIFRDNATLVSLDDLGSLREISGALDIIGNRQLATSAAEEFSQRVSVGDTVTITGNGPG